MRQVQQIFEGSGDGVFGIDRQRRITYVNPAFLQVLGKATNDLRGKPCYDVLCAEDLAACRFCHSQCPIAREALQERPVPHFDLVIPRDGGDRRWVNVGVYPARSANTDPGETRVYFALRSVDGHRLIRKLASELRGLPVSAQSPLLSPRETDVLALAADGLDTSGIGRELCIAPQTVRNHFKNIFAKLDVRSRSQAVALALRRHLL